jgi:hypothetical protein
MRRTLGRGTRRVGALAAISVLFLAFVASLMHFCSVSFEPRSSSATGTASARKTLKVSKPASREPAASTTRASTREERPTANLLDEVLDEAVPKNWTVFGYALTTSGLPIQGSLIFFVAGKREACLIRIDGGFDVQLPFLDPNLVRLDSTAGQVIFRNGLPRLANATLPDFRVRWDITLPQACRIIGRVVDVSSSRPVPDVCVSLCQETLSGLLTVTIRECGSSNPPKTDFT